MNPFVFVIVWISCFVVFVGVSWLYHYFTHTASYKKRIDSIRTSRQNLDNLKEVLFERMRKAAINKKNPNKKSITRELKVNKEQDLCERAGILNYDPKKVFLYGQLGCAFAASIIGYFLIIQMGLLKGYEHLMPNLSLIIFMFFPALGYQQFERILHIFITQRQEEINKALPQALDLMVVCMQAGMGLHKTFERVAKEIVISHPEIGRELGITSVELEFILDQNQALENFAKRIPTQPIRAFISTLSQTIEQGTSLLSSMQVLSKESRAWQIHMAEMKASKIPTIMIVILIFFILPNLFIILLGPIASRTLMMF